MVAKTRGRLHQVLLQFVNKNMTCASPRFWTLTSTSSKTKKIQAISDNGASLVVKSLKHRICKFISSAISVERAWTAAKSLKILSRSDQPFKSFGRKCALARKDFFVACCPKIQIITFFSHVHVLGCTAGGRLRPPPCSRTFASTLVTLQIYGLIIVIDVDLVTLANLNRVKKSGRIQY